MLLSAIVISFIVGVFCMLFVAPVKFARGIVMIMYDGIPKSVRIKCYIPIYNVIYAESLYTGRRSSILITTIIMLLSLMFRFVVLFFLYSSAVLQVISVVLLMLSIVGVYAANVYIVFMVLHDSGVIGIFRQVFYSIVFPMGQNYIGTYLPSEIYAAENIEEAF